MRRRSAGALLLLAALAWPLEAQSKAPAKPAAAATPDFSGTWKLDEGASTNVSPNMKGAVLVVEQKGDRIRISPPTQGAGQVLLAGEEVIADGQPYEKSVGGGKGVLTARWSADRKALELELTGTDPEKKLKMLMTARWSLSADRSTWLRETRTAGDGKVRVNRLIFRRQKPEPPVRWATPKPAKN